LIRTQQIACASDSFCQGRKNNRAWSAATFTSCHREPAKHGGGPCQRSIGDFLGSRGSMRPPWNVEGEEFAALPAKIAVGGTLGRQLSTRSAVFPRGANLSGKGGCNDLLAPAPACCV
jgi:hypothetical protein